jgi:hypothetical protein
MTIRSTRRQANYMNAAEKAGEKAWGKMGGGKLKSGSGRWQSQGVSNPCLRRERNLTYSQNVIISTFYVENFRS